MEVLEKKLIENEEELNKVRFMKQHFEKQCQEYKRLFL